MPDQFANLGNILKNLPGIDVNLVTRVLPSYTSHAHARVRSLQRAQTIASTPPANFRTTYEQTWTEALDNLQAWKTRKANVTLPQAQKLLLVGWYFPEVLTLLSAAQQHNVLILVSQDAPWLDGLKQTGHTLNFGAPGATQTLIAQMQSGRTIFAMLDIVYPDTKYVVAPFFGRPARTASGILELAVANHYTVAVLGPRDTKVEIVAQTPASGRQVVELATWVNQAIEQEIVRAPHRWLMWHALGARYKTQ